MPARLKTFTMELRRAIQHAREQLISLGLALVIHFALLLGVNLFVRWPQSSPRFALRQMSFDFIVNKIDESNRTTEEKQPRPKRSSRQSSPPAVSPASQSNYESAQNFTPATTTVNSTLDQAQQRDSFNGGALDDGTEMNPLPAYVEPVTPFSNNARVTPKLIPYKFAVHSSQRRAILKKVREIVAQPLALTTLDSSFALEKNGQRFQFNLRHLPAQSATGLDELWVGVTTVDGDDTLATELRMKRLAFSQFAQFIDYWDPRVALHDDEFDGRFHSNSAMVISGNSDRRPQFRGKVTTAAYSIQRSASGFYLDHSEIFLAGLEAGAASIPLPRVFLGIPRDTSRSAGGVNILAEESWITFHEDGVYSWRTASSPRIEHRAKFSKEPRSIIGRGQARLHLKGVINGLWLIYSEDDIIIDGNLLYAHDPEVFPHSGDFLGLVSAKDVEVAPPAVTGPGDLKIYAALLAKGRFRVPHLYTRSTGTLHIYGSLAAGSITATEPRYATRVRFDKRFEKMRPPNFPMTNRYEIAEWDERWMVK